MKVIGPVFLLIGFIFLLQSLQYPIGSMSRPGSGVFPLIVSSLLCVIGLVAYKTTDFDMCAIAWQPIILIVMSVLTFCFFTYITNWIIGFLSMSIVYFYGSTVDR